MSRQCKGCRTGESLRRQGAAQRGPHSWDTAQSQERHGPTGQSRRRHHPGPTLDWLRAHAHFHSALGQRLLQQLIRTHPTPSRCSLVLRYIVLSSLVSLLRKGATHHPRLLTSRIIIRHLNFNFIDFSLTREVISIIYYVYLVFNVKV